MAKKMKVTIFVEPGRIALDEKPIPEVGPLHALVRVTTTTICSTDVYVTGREWSHDRPRAGRRHREARFCGSRIHRRAARHRRSNHSEWLEQRLPLRLLFPGRCWQKHGWKGDGRRDRFLGLPPEPNSHPAYGRVPA